MKALLRIVFSLKTFIASKLIAIIIFCCNAIGNYLQIAANCAALIIYLFNSTESNYLCVFYKDNNFI